MKAKVTSAAIVASFAIIIGSAMIPLVAALVDNAFDDYNAFNDYGGGLQWGAIFTSAALSVAFIASVIAGVAAAGVWFQAVHIRVALIAAVIASIGWAINIVRSGIDDAMAFLVFAVGIPIVGALVAMIVVAIATGITRIRRVVQEETYRVVQEHQKEEPNGPDLK